MEIRVIEIFKKTQIYLYKIEIKAHVSILKLLIPNKDFFLFHNH